MVGSPQRRIAIFAAVVLLIFFVAFWFLHSFYFRSLVASYLKNYLQQQYGIRTDFDQLSISFIPLDARFENGRIYGEKNIFLSAKVLELELPYSSLWSNDFRISGLAVDSPQVDFNDIPHMKAQPPSTGTFHLDQLALQGGTSKYDQYKITNIQLTASGDSNSIQLQKLLADWNGLHLETKGSIQIQEKVEYNLTYQINGDAAALHAYAPLSGPIKDVGHVQGSGNAYAIEGELQADGVSYDGSAPFQIFAKHSIQPELYDIDATWKQLPLSVLKHFSIPEFDSVSSGTLKYHGGNDPWRGNGSVWVVIEGKQLNGNIGGKLDAGAIQLDGTNLNVGASRLFLSGVLNATAMQIGIDASIPKAADLAFLSPALRQLPGSYQIEGVLVGSYNDLVFQGNVGARDSDIQLIARGQYKITSGEMSADYAAKFNEHAVKRYYPVDLAGNFELKGTASGTTARPKLDATLNGADVAVKGIQLGQVNAAINSDGHMLDLHLTLPAFSSKVDGKYFFRNANFELTGELQNIQIEQWKSFLPPQVAKLNGDLSGTWSVSGNMNRWKQSNAQANLVGHLMNGPFAISGTVSRGLLNLHVHAENDLQIVNTYTPSILAQGAATIDAHVTGTIETPAVQGALTASNYFLNIPSPALKFKGSQLLVNFTETGGTVQTDGTLNNASVHLAGKLNRSGEGSVSLQVRALDVATLLSEATGTVDINVEAHGNGLQPENWTGFAEVTPNKLQIQQTSIEFERIRLDLQNGVVSLTPFQVHAANFLDFVTAGTANLHAHTLSVQTETEADLSYIKTFLPDVQAAGKVKAEISAIGDWKQPVFAGMLQISDGFLRMSGYPFVLENIELKAPLQKDGIQIQSFQAQMGGGEVTGGGSVSLPSLKMDLWMRGQNVSLNYPEGLRSQLNADLKFQSQETKYLLSGDIAILQSSYSENIDPTRELVQRLLSEKQLLVPEQGFADRVQLQLQVQTTNPLSIKNNLAQLRASARLKVGGTIGTPILTGRITLPPGGQIVYTNPSDTVRLRLTEYSTIEFTGDPLRDPYFHITASTTLRENPYSTDQVVVHECNRIELSGPVQEMDFTVDCEGLTKQEALTLAATGSTAVTQAGVSNFLGQQLTSLVAGSIQRSLGLDIRFQPFGIATEKDPSARLTLSKRFSRELTATYSLTLSGSSEQAWIAEYETAKSLSLRFIDTGSGDYAASVNQRLLFGGGSRRAKRYTHAPYLEPLIESAAIENSSNALTQDTIDSTLKLKQGAPYDYWKLQDSIDQLKIKFQQAGYLFPQIKVKETRTESGNTILQILIADGGKRQFTITGAEPSGLNQYQRWWREAFSESEVIARITEDLEKDQWQKGYFRAVASETTVRENNGTTYQFHVESGPLYQDASLILEGAIGYPQHQLLETLRKLYRSQNEMIAESLHRFPDLKHKIVALYVEQGFLQPKVGEGASQFADGRMQKTLLITEGPRSHVAQVVVTNKQGLPDELAAHLKLQEGTPYRPLWISDDEMTIRSYYQNHGYRNIKLDSKVKQVDDSPNVEIVHELQTGNVARVRSVEVTGNEHTRTSLIQSNVTIHEGDVLTASKLAEIQANLNKLRLFDRVSIRAEESQIPDEYNVIVNVRDRKHYEWKYGLRYSSEQTSTIEGVPREGNLEGETQFTDSNLLGTGQNAFAYAKVRSDFQRYVLGYNSPSILNWDWNAIATLSQERTQREQNSFVTTIFTFQQQYQLTKALQVLAIYKYNHERTSIILENIPIDFNLSTSRVIGVFLGDLRNDQFDPTRGQLFSTEVEYAPTFLGSDIRFIKTFSQFFNYVTLSRITFASGIRFGIGRTIHSMDELLLSEKYNAGGATTIRGFGFDELGGVKRGEAVLILNQEARFPILSRIGGVVFYDGGNVYPRYTDFSFSDLRNTAGFGFRVHLPYGLLGRFDVGFNLDPRAGESKRVYHFGIGQAF